MIEKISEDELDFIETLYDSNAAIEILFTDLANDNLAGFDEEKFGNVRLGQFPLLSDEYAVDTGDPNLSEKQNFQMRMGAGTVYCFGGRKFGKTLFTEKTDLCLDMILNSAENIGFSSYDALHIEGVLEDIINAFENHPFLKIYDSKVKRNPYSIYLKKNKSKVLGVNMNLQGENPGSQFFQKHFNRLFIEEASFETEEVYKKRLDSISENGCVFRVAGMTDFTKHMPAGKIFYSLHNKKFIVNYPQYINPKWDEKEKIKAIEEHGGEESLTYRIFVKGEVVEDGISAIDMFRVRENCYNLKKNIKHFEVTKDNFVNYESIIIVERPKNADRIYIAADIGESAATEIIIISEVNKDYKYLYNITCYNLTDKEQYRIFKYLGQTLNAELIGMDTTEGTGRAIIRSLEENFQKENLISVSFNEKLNIEVERDENGNAIFKDGQPVYIEEYVDSWSVKRLRDILYAGRMEIPMDYKLDGQLNSVIVTLSGTRTRYTCKMKEDHLFAAFRVFFIMEWLNFMTISKPVIKKIFSKMGV